jgi:predicted nucleic acid-binding protein
MPDTVISDASCLILLSKIDSISLLELVYSSVITTPEIASEVGFNLPDWITLHSPTGLGALGAIPTSVDRGEATAIALALELPGCTLIVDDLAARNFASRLGIHVTGTLGVLVKAKLDGHVPSIKPFIEKIRQTNFRFSDRVERNAYLLAGEVDD